VSPSRRWNPAWSRITTWTASGSVFNLSGIQFVWEIVWKVTPPEVSFMKWFLIRHRGTAKEETFSFLENPKTAPSSTNRSIWRHPRSVLICADLWDKGPCLFVIHDPFLTASLGDLPNLAVNPSSKRRRCGPHRPTGVQEVSRKMRDTAGGTRGSPSICG
jgi:hypothetical protein